MSEASNRREFLLKTAATVAAVGAVAACGGGDSVSPAQFAYGVASGDPLADRVILWTHAKIPGSNAVVPLTWEVASDSSFKTIVSTGKVETLEANAFTAKVDATGLAAGNTYFYRFRDAADSVSPVGTTRTLPTTSITSLKLAVFSCSLYSEGFFGSDEFQVGCPA